MARELLAESRIEDGKNPNDAYAAAANVALGTVLERWTTGLGPPAKDAHVKNIHVHDADDNLVGFRLYLAWSEPQVYGKPQVEKLEA